MSHKFRPLKTINIICKRCGHDGNIEVTELQKNTAAVNFVAKFRTRISALESERDKLRAVVSDVKRVIDLFGATLAALPRGEKEKG